MITAISALIGFVGSIFPDLLAMVKDRADREHELIILDMQLKQQREGHSQRLAEIHAQADVGEAKLLYTTYATGVLWVDALNGTVRPVLAYAFFLLYLMVKWMQFSMFDSQSALPWQFDVLWGEEDRAIFAGIIAFYYGQRAMSKLRGK